MYSIFRDHLPQACFGSSLQFNMIFKRRPKLENVIACQSTNLNSKVDPKWSTKEQRKHENASKRYQHSLSTVSFSDIIMLHAYGSGFALTFLRMKILRYKPIPQTVILLIRTAPPLFFSFIFRTKCRFSPLIISLCGFNFIAISNFAHITCR
jgi:hypothetical protein